MSEWAIVADYVWRLVILTLTIRLAMSLHEEGKRWPLAFILAITLLIAAGYTVPIEGGQR